MAHNRGPSQVPLYPIGKLLQGFLRGPTRIEEKLASNLAKLESYIPDSRISAKISIIVHLELVSCPSVRKKNLHPLRLE